ncbi:GyrI-like domain-containing protein [Halobacillus mangrovi]|uniref:GyrI-like domain-containing protein n=1 Tax=Halobacillus mangrovi TaxID=402384 RepID=UPI003D95B3DA
MTPKLIQLEAKKLIGKSKQMSLNEDRTVELWRSFMPKHKTIKDRIDDNLYNMKVFDEKFDPARFTPDTPFQKWAVVEVREFDEKQDELEPIILNGGLYVMFYHHGPASEFHKTLQSFYEEWLPSSNYLVDNREHFERFTKEYNPMDSNAVEEVWIPVKNK